MLFKIVGSLQREFNTNRRQIYGVVSIVLESQLSKCVVNNATDYIGPNCTLDGPRKNIDFIVVNIEHSKVCCHILKTKILFLL